jgi:adenylate cyclase
VGAVAGVLYAVIFNVEVAHSAIRGAFIGTPIILYERGTLFSRWRNAIREAAAPVVIPATIAT